MAVVWAGLDSVLPGTIEGPHVATVAAWPVQVAGSVVGGATGAKTAGSSPSPSISSSPSATETTPPAHTASASASASAALTTAASSSSAAGTEKRYTTAGGTAVLTLYPDHAVLDAAIPNSGFSARSWTNTDMLEVAFSPSGTGAVYEVIATWNGTSPQVNTYTVGG